MSTPRINERAWAIDVISEINRLSAAKSRPVRSAGGEWSVAAEAQDTVIFPDVLLFGDPTLTAVIQGWELKMPDTPVTDGEFLGKAEEKARALGLGSFIVWNVREAVLYVAAAGVFKPERSWSCRGITNRADIQLHRDRWIALLEEILDTVNDFLEKGQLAEKIPIDKQMSVVVIAIVDRCQGRLALHLKECAGMSREWRTEVSAWWRDISYEYPVADSWRVLAADILLHWIHRFLFAHYLKRYVSDAQKVDSLNLSETPSVDQAERVFAELSGRHDYAQLFQPRSGSKLIPKSIWTDLLAFNGFLCSARIDGVDQELLHAVLNAVRQTSQRKAAGQFCTPRPLADLLVRLTLDDVRVPVLDPCCGTGTIAKAVISFKREQGMDAADALSTTWASDKYPLPLQFATLALASGEAPAHTLRIFQHDLATLVTGQRISFVDAVNGRPIRERLAKFPCIVLNPPFVRFEDWGRYNPAASQIASFVSATTDVQLDAKSDLFAPLILHLWRLIATNGRVGVVVSNAWLGADWGVIFRKALLKLFAVETVVISANGRWFKDAKVVTNLLVLRRRAAPTQPDGVERTTFAAINRPIELWTKDTISEIADAIIRADAPNSPLVSVNHVTAKRLDVCDILGLSWSAHFVDLAWIDKISSALIPANQFFDVKRGERRGWDELFFPPADAGIEPCYLRPVLKTSSDASRLRARPNGKAFCCSATLDELRRLGHVKALRWIERFAKARNEKGHLLPGILNRSGMRWYEMRPETVADLAAAMNYDTRLFFLRLTPRAFVNQRLIRFTTKPGILVDLDLWHALLCSLMGCFYIEALGFGRGLGALDLNASKFAKQLRLLNPTRQMAIGRINP